MASIGVGLTTTSENLAHKIIITGTGRAGTTFLVQLLTRLGFDTGYNPGTLHRDYFAHCCAGLEHDPEDPKAPYIVKNPQLCDRLPAILSQRTVAIDHAIIPVRSLDDAASSRIRIGGDGQTPGGLWGTNQQERQKSVLAEKFHELVYALTAHEIPHTFLLFPRFAQDPDYTRRMLGWLLVDIPRAEFLAAFNATARPELIHSFADQPTENNGEAARAFAVEESLKRHRRRTRRLIGAGILAAMVVMWIGWAPANATDDDDVVAAAPAPPAVGASDPWQFVRYAFGPIRNGRLGRRAWPSNRARRADQPH